MDTTAVVLANGEPPTKSLLQSHLRNAGFFVCADGGSNIAARYNLVPHLIIGDLDSIESPALKKFKRVQVLRVPDQNSTDLEKAIAWLVRREYTDIVVLGALGKRLDHSVGNLSALAKFSKAAHVRFVDQNAELSYVGRDYAFAATPGTTVSLIPLSLCEGIVTNGLKWELRNEALELGFRESTSNIVRTSPVRIRVRRGDLLLYRFLEPTKQRKGRTPPR